MVMVCPIFNSWNENTPGPSGPFTLSGRQLRQPMKIIPPDPFEFLLPREIKNLYS